MSDGLAAGLAWTESDPDEPMLAAAVADLASHDGDEADRDEWPEALWATIDRIGATKWSLPDELGGSSCSRPVLVQRCARLASGSLTAAFILSQHEAGLRRLMAAPEQTTASRWLQFVAHDQGIATVGISHLTTSRRLGSQAIRIAEAGSGRYRLDGMMPWVTGATRADVVVTGGAFDDGRQALIALPMDAPGLTVRPPFPLAALQASCTCEIALEGVEVLERELLAGPATDILSHPGAVGTGGLETSALAIGQARAALSALVILAPDRDDLTEPLEALCETWRSAWGGLMAQARGEPDAPQPARIRAQANSLVIRATQAYLTARKGTGFLRTEAAQRWARQAMFFLVWSCPAPIARAAIRDLAGLCPASS